MFRSFIFSIIALFASAVFANAADYTIHSEVGQRGCYNKDKRLKTGAKFCHNCKKSGGDRVKWNFRVFCDGKPTEKVIISTLGCGKKTPKEGKQLRILESQAEEFMEDKLSFISELPFSSCKLGDKW